MAIIVWGKFPSCSLVTADIQKGILIKNFQEVFLWFSAAERGEGGGTAASRSDQRKDYVQESWRG